MLGSALFRTILDGVIICSVKISVRRNQIIFFSFKQSNKGSFGVGIYYYNLQMIRFHALNSRW